MALHSLGNLSVVRAYGHTHSMGSGAGFPSGYHCGPGSLAHTAFLEAISSQSEGRYRSCVMPQLSPWRLFYGSTLNHETPTETLFLSSGNRIEIKVKKISLSRKANFVHWLSVSFPWTPFSPDRSPKWRWKPWLVCFPGRKAAQLVLMLPCHVLKDREQSGRKRTIFPTNVLQEIALHQETMVFWLPGTA